MQKKQSSHRQQKGATLIVALVILVLIMMAGITAVTSSSTQTKLAGNLQFEDTAMNRAEEAVAVAERWLMDATLSIPNSKDSGFTTRANATPHLYPSTALVGDPLTMTWSDASSRQVASDRQRWMIEQIAANSSLMDSDASVGGQEVAVRTKVNIYRVTARAQAPRGATKFVQTMFGVLVAN